MNPDQSKTRRQDFEKRLARYALAGTAVMGMPLLATTGPPSVSATVGNTPTLDFAFDGGSDTDFTIFESFSAAEGAGLSGIYNPYIGVSGPDTTLFFGATSGPFSINYPTAFPSSSAVTPGSTVSGANNKLLEIKANTLGPNTYLGNFPNNGSAYLGMTFQIAGQQYLGWADLLISAAPGGAPNSVPSIHTDVGGLAFADITITDSGFLAAAPEPSSLALFALGAVGLLGLRKRRSAVS